MKQLENLGFALEQAEVDSAWKREREGGYVQRITVEKLPLAPKLMASAVELGTFTPEGEEIHRKHFTSLREAIQWLTGDV